MNLSIRDMGRSCEMTFAWRCQLILKCTENLLYDLELDTRLRFRAIERNDRAGYYRLPPALQRGANPPSPDWGNINTTPQQLMASFQAQQNYTGHAQLRGGGDTIFGGLFDGLL